MSELPTNERIAHLDSRVTGLEQGIKDVAGAVRDLATDFKDDARRRGESSKTPWSVILTAGGLAMTVIISIGGLAYLPIREGVLEIKANLRDLDHSQVPRVEHEKVWEFQRRLGEINQRRIERLESDFYRPPKS